MTVLKSNCPKLIRTVSFNNNNEGQRQSPHNNKKINRNQNLH